MEAGFILVFGRIGLRQCNAAIASGKKEHTIAQQV
jgi:hypothetical protein